jgi:uncharacterized membrane protein YraQ (UPF0718 family)
MESIGDILGGIAGAAGNIASGGILGLFGSVVGVVGKYFQEKQRQKWEIKKHDMEVEMQRLQMEARAEETEQEIQLASAQGAWQGLQESYGLNIAKGEVSQWVNNVRSLFRPFLTIMLWIVAIVVIWLLVSGLIAGYIKEDTVAELIEYSVRSLIFAASTATVWWFGDRALSPPNAKHR